ncbi:MAG: acyl-CoA synthetase/AMP-acid ligase, partial [Evtepia sp.]|nr:acyl-CoA synthetase/AMP-acid ligase [Evtepia sp.]
MSIYQRFCHEAYDSQGRLISFSLQYPENYNFGYDVVDAIAEETPDKEALVWCNAHGVERTFTFDEIRRYSNQVANVLKSHGIGKGDTVLVMLKRHFEYWFVAVALHKLGAVMAPVTHMLTTKDIIYRAQAGNIKTAICTSEDNAPAHFLEAKEECGLSHIWTVHQSIDGCLNLTEEMQSASSLFPRVETLASEPILTYFTSGTTGLPKGVIHNHTYTLAHIVTAKYWHRATDGGLHFTVAETGWGKASWGKIYGQWLVGSAVMVFDFDNFDPRQLMNVINRYKVTTFCAPPTIYRYLVKTGLIPMPSLEHTTTAG